MINAHHIVRPPRSTQVGKFHRDLKDVINEAGIHQSRIAKALKINKGDVSYYLNGKFHKTSKKSRKAIRKWLINNGLIIIKPRPPKICWNCGCVHPHKKKPF